MARGNLIRVKVYLPYLGHP